MHVCVCLCVCVGGIHRVCIYRLQCETLKFQAESDAVDFHSGHLKKNNKKKNCVRDLYAIIQ